MTTCKRATNYISNEYVEYWFMILSSNSVIFFLPENAYAVKYVVFDYKLLQSYDIPQRYTRAYSMA